MIAHEISEIYPHKGCILKSNCANRTSSVIRGNDSHVFHQRTKGIFGTQTLGFTALTAWRLDQCPRRPPRRASSGGGAKIKAPGMKLQNCVCIQGNHERTPSPHGDSRPWGRCSLTPSTARAGGEKLGAGEDCSPQGHENNDRQVAP